MENKVNINGIKEQLSQKATPENIRLEPLEQPTKQVSEQVIEPPEKKVEQRKDYLLSVYNYYLNSEQIAICE